MYPYPTDRKRRAQGACDFCRKKKVRCDSATRPGNICYNCQNAEVECTHNAEHKKRGPRVGTIRKHPSESVQALITAVLAEPKSYPIPDDPGVIRKMLVDLSQCVRGLERQMSRWRRTVQEISVPYPPIGSQSDSEESDSSEDVPMDDVLATSVQGFTLNNKTESPRRHFGKSSNLVLMRTAVDIKKEVIGDQPIQIVDRRPEFWTVYPWQRQILRLDQQRPLRFPSDDLLWSLIDLYFVHVHPYHPLLHRPTFITAVSHRLHIQDYGFGSVLLCVCAIASRFSKDPRNYVEGVNTENSLGWTWYQQVSQVQAVDVEPPTLYQLQHCCLSALYLKGTSMFHSTWGVIGLGIRFAQEMGVHRKQKGQPSTVQTELWRRAFWVLLGLDVLVSINFGRPRATTDDDFDLEPPIECDDDYWENEDPSQAFIQPSGVPSMMSFFICYSKLLEIAGLGHRMLFSARKLQIWKKVVPSGPHWDHKVVTELNSALNQWMSCIPEHLKWDPNREDGLFHRQSCILYCFYYWTQIQIHKQFIPRSNESSMLKFPSLAICANAGRSVVRILEVIERIDFEILPNFTSPVYVAAIVLLMSIWRNKYAIVPQDTSKDMDDVRHSLKATARYEKKYQIAGRINDALSSMIYMVELYFSGQSATRASPSDTAASVSTGSASSPDDLFGQAPNDNSSSSSSLPITSNFGDVPENSSLYHPNIHPRTAVSQNVIRPEQAYSSDFANYTAGEDHHMGVDSEYSAVNSQVTVQTLDAAVQEEDWTTFMANVDEVLQAVDTSGFSYR
ncbi:fungal-specific transcription factor domain-containing protein [Lentinula boryana]|uniref:Fungal-specific transcription factor domain-containing protein n=1 Tax=Lentinula boryana TaxID=40481 RepID=A0ABQ8QGY7_9AGAR|nr:fungal-specific transcription factor domain-containing protein [Lentinula boryana]